MTKVYRKNHSQKMEALTPRRTSKRHSFSSRRGHEKDNNPYSTRGLDKFSALVAELEEKRQKIYSQMGSDDISFVRFVYKDSDDCVPIIVKMKKDQPQQDKTKGDDIKARLRKQDSEIKEKFPIDSSSTAENKEANKQQPNAQSDNKITKKKNFSWNMKLSNWRQPSYYFPAVVMLILLFLIFFGRSFAILCTSIGWYVLPTLKTENSSNVRKFIKKKEYVRKFSDNKMATARLSFNNSRPVKDQSSPKHDHRKSF
ncbi:putative ZCF37 [Melia azedarach]|uniref:ZCF37 n=1 Tax=Melia azedarach TaxID=155640 RepID=A0ACC1WRK8_MELAZ|nr:putative ZCF37 [Melia azedarach]